MSPALRAKSPSTGAAITQVGQSRFTTATKPSRGRPPVIAAFLAYAGRMNRPRAGSKFCKVACVHPSSSRNLGRPLSLGARAMRVGIHLPQIGRKAGPEAIRRAAIQAEELGFADVWTSEHIIIPKGAPYPPSALFYDPILTLTWAAAFTKRVRLGTSVLVLPMRHPLPLAKELATLQNLSEGRLILGAGVGWMAAEFAALG